MKNIKRFANRVAEGIVITAGVIILLIISDIIETWPT